MNGYELRLQMWRSADAFLQNRYRHQKQAYEAGLIPEKPEFPTYAEVSAYALQMREFIHDKGEAND
tara:strand:+ start:363 stop:560 length:198 start_codon:yes stop_codon:yes gene_type:complete